MISSYESVFSYYVPQGHIAFGVDPVGVRVSCLHSYHLNQWVDFDQTSIETLLEAGKEVIRFCDLALIVKVTPAL